MTEADWFACYCDHAERKRDDIVPFPADEVQVLTNGQKGLTTAKGAVQIWENLKESIEAHRALSPDLKVLDYGCGWGRITRILLREFEDDNIYGVDVDPGLIKSAQACVPSCHFSVIESMKPLPFEAESFDIIFANSVFSHLSERSAVATLAELQRVTKPGGLVITSVLERPEMEKFYSRTEKQKEWITGILGPLDKASATLDAKGFVWGDTGRWKDYGIAIMTNEWVRDLFAKEGLDLLASTRTTNPGSQNYKVGLKK